MHAHQLTIVILRSQEPPEGDEGAAPQVVLQVVARAIRGPEASEGVAVDVHGVLARQRVAPHSRGDRHGGGGGGDGGEDGAGGVGVALLVVDDDVPQGPFLHVSGQAHAKAEKRVLLKIPC